MNFINVSDIWREILRNRQKLPADIDLVVGIPRSGLLPATMLATQLNVPMTDLEGLVANRIFGYGATKSRPDVDQARSADRTVLVIDDTVGSGRAFKEARAALAGVEGTIIYCAVFASVSVHPDVDVVLKKVELAPICQWNMMHHAVLANACVDIDGVLCRNPEVYEDDGGEAYRKFLRTAEKLHATSGEIGWLVTSRKETYRAETEAWLAANGVQYRTLLMAETEEDHADSPAYKAKVFQEVGAELFIESEAADAARIAEISGKPVLCVATQSMVGAGGSLSDYLLRVGTRRRAVLPALKLHARRMLGDRAYYLLKGMAGRS